MLVERFQGAAYRSAVAALGDPHLAWDAAQEAFLTAYCSLDQLRAPDAFPGWLSRIVRTHCRRLRRDNEPPLASLEAVDGSEPGAHLLASGRGAQSDPAAVAEGRERRAVIASTVRMLPAGQQVVIVLFYVGGYPQHEIAERLGLPLTTVKKRLQAARRQLQVKMVSLMDEDVPRQRGPQHLPPRTAWILHLARVLTTVAVAASDDDGSALELLLLDGLDVNAPDGTGRTLLSWAARRGQVGTIAWLLRHGAAVNGHDRAGRTPLGWAERARRHDAAALLRRSGAVR